VFVFVGGGLRLLGLALLLAYAAALVVSGVHAALRFHSVSVGLLQPFAVVASQATYLCGFLRGLTERAARAQAS
jgi:hypothetical protein